MKRAWLVAWLTVVWVGLWGSATPAILLGGLAVGLLLVRALPLADVASSSVVAPTHLLRFVGFFVVDLVRSSVQVTALVLRPRRPLRQAVVAVPVRGASDQLLTLLANAISLTPGTLTLEVDRPRSTLYVHVLDVGADVEQVRGDILAIERLAILAVGSAQCRAALAQDHPVPDDRPASP